MGYSLENEMSSNFNSLLEWFNQNCINNNQDFIHNKIKENFSYSKIANEYKELVNKIF